MGCAQRVEMKERKAEIRHVDLSPEEGEFLADVWLRTMLKTGLMGYMADILQYARDLRPFHTDAIPQGHA